MLEIKKIDEINTLSALKEQYFASANSALDGMWHVGFVGMSQHFGFYENQQLVGYCCINDDAYVLQFYMLKGYEARARELFTLIAQGNSAIIGELKGAFVSTAETAYLSLCLDCSSNFSVNAFMYQYATNQSVSHPQLLSLTKAGDDHLASFVAFAAENIGAPEQWLQSYYSNLIQRQELWGYWRDGQLLASGECRLFDQWQTEFADLGMIVAKSERGQGLAARVLTTLTRSAIERGLLPICSTEANNIAAQKAIERAGLSSSQRIIQFEFG
ncbi:hypothetical protein AHAT_37440 [Agarivorans sp. Toyoura001]|uniref:GNAT family N-acetyltransferase n=1 Tax=Agarivorans sp. Toyoura001 TaxID=2283141 RepID=UPI0010E586C3|nr:GNAT family N-acetyltransferase [Agarivorans sp. Toyoura001]GDY27854.1 hypothetical protein AHAT_37440 [Agarivorans sp. Toyoura001]